MAYLFEHGTCKKSELYDVLLDKMQAAGWQNISSNVQDGEVMYSTGTAGDKTLYVQLFPYDAQLYKASAVNYDNATYNIRTSKTSNAIGIRLCLSYMPGTDGQAGTIPRQIQNIFTAQMINIAKAVDPEAICEYDVYADKNKVIFSTKAPDILGGRRQLIYLGQPDTQYVKNNDGRGVVYAATATTLTYGSIYTADYPEREMGQSGDHFACTWLNLLPQFLPNINKKILLSEPYYQSASTSVIGKLDGIYLLTNPLYVKDGDTIAVNNARFKVIEITTLQGTSSYPTYYAAIQIA